MKKLFPILLAVAALFLSQPPFVAAQGGAEPAVYRVQSEKIQDLEEKLRSRFLNDPGFSVTVKADGPKTFRVCVLAPENIQREIPNILEQFGQILPKTADGSLVRIGQSSNEVPTESETVRPRQGGQHYLHAAPPIPSLTSNLETPKPLPNGVQNIISNTVSNTVSRESFTPNNVPIAKLEQTLRFLLGGKMHEMSPGRFLVSVDPEGTKKQSTLEIDNNQSRLLIAGEPSLSGQLLRLVDAIDQPEPQNGWERKFLTLPNVKPDAIRKIIEINRAPKRLASVPQSEIPNDLNRPNPRLLPTPTKTESSPKISSNQNEVRHLNPKRNPVIQMVGYQLDDGMTLGGDSGSGGSMVQPAPIGGAAAPGTPPTPGMEVVSDFRYQILDDLDVIIIDATGAEVARFTDMIRQIEELSKIAEPKIEVYYLKNVNCISLNWVIFQVYVDLFRTKQGTVKIIPLINPNAMLLIGWGHALDAMKDLIETLDKPVAAENNMLRVFALKHAAAQYVLTALRGMYPIPPVQNSGFAPRIQMFADARTNSIIVQAGPNDLKEIERIVKELDVEGAGPKLQVKTFKLKNTMVNDLAQVLTDAITPGISGTSDKKLPALQMLVMDEKGRRMIESGIMADVKISKDVRTNTLIITAPENCMSFIEGLINALDSPAATAEIKVFQIMYGDANSMVKTLESLIPTQLAGQTGPQLPGAKNEDALIPVRFAIDTRTNSILAAGAPNDLKIVEALLYSLDREDQQTRKETVYQLKSMQAKDVATAINEYVRSKRLIQQASPGVVSPYQQIESEVIVIAEAVSNSLIVSATPRFYDEVMQLIKDIDRSPPQVVIQVLIGEVTLNNTEEFGAEFGIQDSLLFNRSTFENLTTGTRKISRTENGVTTVLEEPIIVNGTATPGWLFNQNPANSLGDGYNSVSAQTVGEVGSQLLTNFATGRVGAETGFGGMVFSANSDAVSIMIRALEETNRLEILSRPQITAMNNQKAFIHVGQLVPRVKGTTSNNYSQDTRIEDEKVGLMLMVTPSISPEGKVVMLVAAEKSSVGANADGVPVGFSDGKEVRSPKINIIHAMTMISAADNETVVLGGLISKENQEVHRRVPFISDIPVLGKLFQYKYCKAKRSELLIIMTPRIVRNECDMEKIKQIETARMSWCLSNVVKLHGDIGTYNCVAEHPYAGDAVVVCPEAVDMETLTPVVHPQGPVLQAPQQQPIIAKETVVEKKTETNTETKTEQTPKLAPPPPVFPTPVLPNKTDK